MVVSIENVAVYLLTKPIPMENHRADSARSNENGTTIDACSTAATSLNRCVCVYLIETGLRNRTWLYAHTRNNTVYFATHGIAK